MVHSSPEGGIAPAISQRRRANRDTA